MTDHLNPTTESHSAAPRRASYVAYALAAVLFAGGAVMALKARGPAVPVAAATGARAPEFDLEVLGKPGERLALSDLRGRPVLIVFNCGCKMCYALNGPLVKAAPKMKDLQIVGIMMNSYSYSPPMIRSFREATGFNGPLLIDHMSQITETYDSDDCPRVWLVDKDGIIRYHNKSNEEAPEKIIADLRAAYETL